MIKQVNILLILSAIFSFFFVQNLVVIVCGGSLISVDEIKQWFVKLDGKKSGEITEHTKMKEDIKRLSEDYVNHLPLEL